MNSPSRFVLRHLAFAGEKVEQARLDFDDGVNFIYGASNTGKSFIRAALSFMLGGKTKDLPEITEREGYDTAWLGLTLPTLGDVTLSRATKGGPFELRQGLWTAGNNLPMSRSVGENHDAERADTLSQMLLSELGLTGKKIAKNKSGNPENFTFRQLVPIFLVNETSIQGEYSPVETGAREETRERAVFRLLITGQDDSAIGKRLTSPEFRVSKQAKLAAIAELIEALDGDIARAAELIGTVSKEETVEARLAVAQKAWEDAHASLRSLLDRKRLLRDQISALTTRADDIAIHLARFAKLQEVYESDVGRLTALEEAGMLLMIDGERECPLCGALPAHQREEHGVKNIEQQRIAARAEIAKIRKQQADLKGTIADLEAERSDIEPRLAEAKAKLEGVQEDIQRASPSLSENQRALSEVMSQRDLTKRHALLLEQREDLQKRRAEYEKMKQSKKDQPVLKAPETAVHEFCKVMSEVLIAWQFPGDCQVSFDDATFDVKIDGKARRSNGKGVRALTHAAFKVALLLYCRNAGLPHPGVLVLDTPLLAYRDPVRSRQGALEEGEAIIAASPVREKFFRHLSSINDAQFIVLDNVDPPKSANEVARMTFFTGDPISGRMGFFPM